jgi:flagellar assembly factor FliW
MDVATTRFGLLETVDVPEQALLTFSRGIPGFEDHTAFALIEDDRYRPLCWLQSIADPSIGFVLLDPHLILPSFELQLNDEDASLLDIASDADLQVFCILVVPAEGLRGMTANLKAPVVLDRARQRGSQVILADGRYSLRHPVRFRVLQCSS